VAATASALDPIRRDAGRNQPLAGIVLYRICRGAIFGGAPRLSTTGHSTQNIPGKCEANPPQQDQLLADTMTAKLNAQFHFDTAGISTAWRCPLSFFA